MAVIDVAGFVADLKGHAVDHGFHVHDERHFVETYSLRQLWEVDLHPEEACNGPIDLHLSLEVDPRALLGFEDEVMKLDDPDDDPPTGFTFPLLFTWTLPPLPAPARPAGAGHRARRRGRRRRCPSRCRPSTRFASVTDAPERSLSMVARIPIDLADVYLANDKAFCDTLDTVPRRQPVPAGTRRRLARRRLTSTHHRTLKGHAMRVSELIDMLKDQPPDAEVELAIVAPVGDDEDDITVDRYSVEGMLPWQDEDDDGNEEEVVIWLVGGEDDDVEAFLDAIEEQRTTTTTITTTITTTLTITE